MASNDPEHGREVGTTKARQAVWGRPVLIVLGVSLLLAVIAGVLFVSGFWISSTPLQKV